MTKSAITAPGEFYHVYNRGTDKRVIFKNVNDHKRFTVLLYLCNSTRALSVADEMRSGIHYDDLFQLDRERRLVNIGAYCLMPNHFHILLQEIDEGGLSQFMKKLGTSYSMYFNNKYNRTGGLFEGRYKARHAWGDTYLRYLFSYIHLNPVKIIDPTWKETGIANKTKAKKYLDSFLFSSYLDYKGTIRVENSILNSEAFPRYLSDDISFNKHVDDWLEFTQFTQV